MESDDSHDSSSSDSEGGLQNHQPRSPASVQSHHSNSRSSGHRSPSPDEPRTPSPGSRSQSLSRFESHRDSHSPDVDRTQSPGQENRSTSVASVNSSRNERRSRSPISDRVSQNTINSSERHSVDRESVKSDRSLKSPSSDRESAKSESPIRRSAKSPSSDRESSKSRSNRQRSRSRSSDLGSVVSGGSNCRSRSQDSIKSHSTRSPKSVVHDENSSDSSASSSRSKRHKSFSSNVSASIPLEAQAEEISDGEMDLDGTKDNDHQENKLSENKIQLSHEDLSDVSDLDSIGAQSDDECSKSREEIEIVQKPPQDLRQKLEEVKSRKLAETPKLPEKTSKTEDGEEALDFEAEDGECVEETTGRDDPTNGDGGDNTENGEDGREEHAEKKEEQDLEEGEVTDDDETRPEETEPRPVCRFYSRGQCTWGASCRFLHPGVTDKGNYTMFEMIRPVVPGPPPAFGADFRDERASFGHSLRTDPPQAESAWERGLRTAKEMVRRAIKRKEQDMDFEEKKMNLTLSQDELDKENGYYTRAASPVLVEPSPPPVKHYVRHPPAVHDQYYPPAQRHSDEYYRRVHHYDAPNPAVSVRQVRIEPEYEAPAPRERVHSYRELPTHRMPDYYNDKYEERTVSVTGGHKRHNRPKREVIVQRLETSAPPGRGDEWADPWMRSKSPNARAGRSSTRRQSYSSGSSYSSSSSSRSTSGSSRSSYRRRSHRSHSRSRSGSPRTRRRAAGTAVATTTGSPSHGYRRDGRRRGRGVVSPSVIVSERKAAHERASLMNPPAPSPRKPHKDMRPPSPGMMRTSAQNPPAPVKMPATDQFGRTTKREVDRVTSERRNLDPERKKLVVALAARVKGRVARSSRSSSGSESSGSSSSDSESSYSSSSSSREGSPTAGSNKRKISTDSRMELAAIALKAKAIDALKGGNEKRSNVKTNLKMQPTNTNMALGVGIKMPLITAPTVTSEVDLPRKERAQLEVTGKKRPATSPPPVDGPSTSKVAAVNKTNSVSSTAPSGGGKKATSRREELLKQLKAVEDAIAKKRSKIN